jgi:hypothetical protein
MKYTFRIIIIILLINHQSLVSAQTDNLIYGTSAGGNITSGDYNTCIGDSAGFAVTSGHRNIFFGFETGYSLVGSHYNNILIGYQAGFSNSATDNIFIGKWTGYSNTSGKDNTFIGEEAGYSNIDGDDMVIIGEDAGKDNTSGYDNTFVGRRAGVDNTTGYRNAFLGTEAGDDNTTGHHNTAIGDSAGLDNSIGIYNTSIGAGCGTATEYTSFNTFVGVYAGSDNNRTNETTGATRNTYMGYFTGFTNREGTDNVGFGSLADFEKTSGVTHTTVSYSVFLGASSSVKDDGNIAIGYKATASGDNAIVIGKESTASASNAITIGYNTTVSSTNTVYFGNSVTMGIGGVVNWTSTSDGRFKYDVQEDVKGLDFIKQLRPVTYHFDSKKVMEYTGQNIAQDLAPSIDKKNKVRYTGFIAQEVEQAVQNTGFDFSGIDKPAITDKSGQASNSQLATDYFGLRYAEFVVPLVKTTQELSQKINNNSDVIHQWQASNDAFEAALEEVMQRLKKLENNN